MKIKVNGNDYNTDTGKNISDLLEMLNISAKKVVVEVNYEIIPADRYKEKILSEGDNVEIIHFVGGG
jgi:sulfur carrier protein